jgi:hypothetical protein
MLYFSIFSGELFESEDKLTDAFQIPLKKRPNKNCKKCYGRFYTSYNLTTRKYEICPKCLAACLDEKYILDYLKTRQDAKKTD